MNKSKLNSFYELDTTSVTALLGTRISGAPYNSCPCGGLARFARRRRVKRQYGERVLILPMKQINSVFFCTKIRLELPEVAKKGGWGVDQPQRGTDIEEWVKMG